MHACVITSNILAGSASAGGTLPAVFDAATAVCAGDGKQVPLPGGNAMGIGTPQFRTCRTKTQKQLRVNTSVLPNPQRRKIEFLRAGGKRQRRSKAPIDPCYPFGQPQGFRFAGRA